MSDVYQCKICNIQCDSELQLKYHESGRKHRVRCIQYTEKLADIANTESISEECPTEPLKVSIPRQLTPDKTEDTTPGRGIWSSSNAWRQSAMDRFECGSLKLPEFEFKQPRSSSKRSATSSSVRWFCEVCSVAVNSREQLITHESGQKHLRKMSTATPKQSSDPCGGMTESLQQGTLSTTSSPIIQSLKSESSTETFDSAYGSGTPCVQERLKFFFCDLCQIACFASQRDEHDRSVGHQFRLLDSNLMSSYLAEKIPNKHNLINLHRSFNRICQEFLLPVWPNASFTPKDLLALSDLSTSSDDSLLQLDTIDSCFTVGVHFVVGMLTANRDPLLFQLCATPPVTRAIWISPTVQTGPNLSALVNHFRFPPINVPFTTTDCLRVVQCYGQMPNETYDLLLTDPHTFSLKLFEELFAQNRVCCIVLQDVTRLAEHRQLCAVLAAYLERFPSKTKRARIIGLSANTEEPTAPLFKNFTCISSKRII